MNAKYLVALFLAAAALAYYVLLPADEAAGQARQPQGPPPAPVTLTEVSNGSLAATVTATGTVVSRNDARLAAEVTGRLDWVAEPGTRVQKDAPLARVDTRTLELQLREDEASLKRSAANAELLGTQLARLTALPQGIASKSQVDEAAARLSMAKQEVEQARAALDRTRHLIDRAVIRAPFPGHVVERLQQLGEFVSAGTEVVRLTDTGNIEVVARAPVGDANHLRQGQEVRVLGNVRREDSRIRAVVPVGDERSRMLELRIALAGDWAIGSAVRVELPAAGSQTALLVPRDAVIVRADGAYVFRVGADDTAERVPVQLGSGDASRIEVRNGLNAGDRIVVRGGERLRPGQPVRVATADRTTET